MLIFGLNENEKLVKGRGVVEFRPYLDSHVNQLTKKNVSKEPPTSRWYLTTRLYEVIF